MPQTYLTPASISYLTQFLLTSIITVYLVVRFAAHRKHLTRQDGFLLAFFFSFTVLTLLSFLEYSLPPSERLIAFNLENTAVAVMLTALIQFAYHFPTPKEKQKIERRIVLFICCLYILVELKEAIRIFSLLQQGHQAVRPDYLQYVMIAEFAWVVIAFARNAIQNWKLPTVRNFALILLIPLAVATLTNYTTAAVAVLYPIASSIGLLVTIFLFALNYLSSQPERVSFIVKISGAVLTSMLAVLGMLPWLITPAYTDQYVSKVSALDHRTLRFSPDGQGGYLVSEIPLHWEDDLGELVPFPAFNQVVGYDFDFPFLGQAYHRISISGMGGIGLGEILNDSDYQIHFGSTPMIIPLLVCKGEGNDPQRGTYARFENGKAVITWNKNISCIPHASQGGTYAYQVTLFADGRFDISYNGLPDLKFLFTNPEATAWAIGLKPAQAPPGTANFTDLPMKVGTQGALQDEYLAFRLYLHKFLTPMAVAVLLSSLFFLGGTVLVLNYGLAQPLNSLLDGVQNFNTGKRENSIPVQSNDEIGFLTESFNTLGGELNSLINGLEQRVVDRTRELAAANGQLRSEMEARAAAQAQVVEHQRAVATLEERERLARELHDGIGQVLGFINVQAQSANDAVQAGDKEPASQLLERMVEVAQEAHDDVRGYILGLKKGSSTPPRQDFLTLLEQYCQHLFQNFGFRATLNLPADLPLALAAHQVESQFLYIIREALSNARAHSGQREAEVTLTFDETSVWAVIADRGTGFDETYSGPERRKSGHFGLGVMRERAEAVGGSLEIESRPGAGTRVTVRLPRQFEGASTAGLRVLLVDDHPLFLEGMSNLVAGRGMQVVGAASDGLEAQAQARILRPEVILMDIEMPRCDGLEALRHIKAEMSDVKVVMLTVSGEERHLFEALRCGAAGYLLKSLDALELTTLLDELLRGEVSLSPGLANKMLEAFTSHKSPPAQPPGLHPAPEQAELTERQVEILRLVARGRTYKEIAAQLGLAEVTIKYHMGEILARLHLNSKREAVQYVQAGRLK